MRVTFSSSNNFKAKFTVAESIQASFTDHIEVPVTDYYDGSYEFTPTAEEQIIPIIGKTARQNITVSAIPNNYGLITWNGAILTVS